MRLSESVRGAYELCQFSGILCHIRIGARSLWVVSVLGYIMSTASLSVTYSGTFFHVHVAVMTRHSHTVKSLINVMCMKSAVRQLAGYLRVENRVVLLYDYAMHRLFQICYLKSSLMLWVCLVCSHGKNMIANVGTIDVTV